MKLLKKNESAWEFEINGSKRAFVYEEFFSTYNNFITYENSIIKGKWQRKTANNFNINGKDREIMSFVEQKFYELKVLRSKVFNYMPNFVRLLLKG